MPTFRQDEKLGTKVPLIKTADFNDKSVTTEKLAEGSVTNSKLAPESVTQDKFDKELLQIFKAAAGLPENLIETIQNVDSTLADHQRQISSNDDDISDLQTKTKQIKDTVDGIAVSGGASVGSAVTYDNTQSGLDALNIQNAIDELVNNLGHYETNEEWLRAYTDAENKFLWGIRIDGSIDWAVGIPRPIQKQIEKLIATDTAIQKSITQIRTELTESLNNKILSLKDNEIKNLQDTKVDKEEGKSLIEDDVKKCFRVIENEEFIMAVVDADDKVLFGIYRDSGKTYFPLNEMYHVEQNEEFLWVILDAVNHPLLGIQQDGTCWAAKAQWLDDIKAIKEALSSIDETLKTFQPKEDGKGLINLDVAGSFFYISNDEYIIAVVDAENRILAGIKYDAQPYFPNHEMYSVITNEEWLYAIIDAENKILGGFHADDGHMVVGGIDISTFIANATIDIADIKERTAHLSTMDNDEYLSVETDADGKVMSWRDSSGKKHEHDMEVTNLDVSNINLKDNSVNNIQDALKANGFNVKAPIDWSESSFIQIPIPQCAKCNIITDRMPTMKSGMGNSGIDCDIPCYIEFWDMQGNYFKFPILLSAQGDSSMSFPKKNLAMDLFINEDRKDSPSIKFGDWVAQDSFHLKAYYTDFFRGVGTVSYMLCEDLSKTKSISNDRPYKYLLESGNSENNCVNSKVSSNIDTGAKCFPQGFPVIVYVKNNFYGIYSWQLKKHRDNYWMDKKNEKNIHLDGYLNFSTIWGGNVTWGFEIRNPKNLYMQEYHDIKGESTLKYNGDYPFEIMGRDSQYFDASNKDMVRCAKVKEYIQDISSVIEQLQNLRNVGNKEAEIKELFSSRFNVDFLIDYLLETNITGNGDAFEKNWQWTTWDGTKWVANFYDHDGCFGGAFTSAYIDKAPEGWLSGCDSLSIPTGWVLSYYLDEVKKRYGELRKSAIFSTNHIIGLLKNWCSRIGVDNFEMEYEKWNESPCNRDSGMNTTYWELKSFLGFPNWSNTKQYNTGEVVLHNYIVYKAVKQNVAVNPEEDSGENWQNVMYSESTTYNVGDECYAGWDYKYLVACKNQCQGQAPFTIRYTYNPQQLGYHDSIYRVEKWLEKRIKYMDVLLNYN